MPPPTHRRLRAPAPDGAALVDPPNQSPQSLIEQNRALSATWHFDCQGRRLESMVFEARAELLAAATAFTTAYRQTHTALTLTPTTPFVLSGHQPELFHPGVWFKNFLLSAIGRRAQAFAINLIVDTDLARKTSLSVPTRHGNVAAIENVAYDAGQASVPYEERAILDDGLFQSFPERVRQAYEPARFADHRKSPLLLDPLWSHASRAARRIGPRARLGQVLAEARHSLEATCGLGTLELPLSAIAQTTSFRWFLLHLLAHLPRLWRIYNAALADYRRLNHIRSHTHPVPALEEHHEWREAPLFAWSTSHPERRRLFARQTRSELLLTDRQSLDLSLEMSAEGSPDKAIEQLAAAEARGIKLRPRALITTMYARLLLSDLFIHGIGGAKYDELTDQIIQRYFGFEPPAYLTATATFRLPIERPQVTASDTRRVAQKIRDTRYRPESLSDDPLLIHHPALREQLAGLAQEKRDYLRQHDLRRGSRDAYLGLDRLNTAMRRLLLPVADELRREQARLSEEARQARLLGSREFSFVLHSDALPARLLDLSELSS